MTSYEQYDPQEATTSTALPPQRTTRQLVRRPLLDSAYLLTGFPIALAAFIVLVTGMSTGVGLIIIWVGLPLMVATLYVGRGFAAIERHRLELCGAKFSWVSPPRHPGTLAQRLVRPLVDSQLWREYLHGIISFPISVITWSITVTWWAMIFAGLTGWIWEPFLPADATGSSQLMDILHWPLPGVVFDLLVGIFALVTLPLIVRGCALIHVGLGRALLTQSRGSLEKRVVELSQARDQLGKAETDALRRLERDLHDGPQQTLIRLGMDLAAAERRLGEGDQEATASLIAESRKMTEAAIGELRTLSRGIAPPVLAERGLRAALVALAADCPIEVKLRYALTSEPPQGPATAAYYVVSEALSNSMKYSSATLIEVHVGLDDFERLLLEVSDNGTGGAQMVPNHGLSGLKDRVTALDGSFSLDVSSGTSIRATLPL